MTDNHALTPPPVESGQRPHFSLVRVSGDHLFLSGQLPFGPDKTIRGGDVAAQTDQCLDNIQVLLSDYALGLEHVVKCTVWLSRVEDFPAFNAAYAKRFNMPEPPARSTVRADLMVPGALVEIEAIAHWRRHQSP